MRRKLLLCLCAAICFVTHSYSQSKTITGKVTDVSGYPLANVSVLIKGTQTGTVTDETGSFSLNVSSANAILVFTYSGLTDEEVKVGNRSIVNAILKSDERSMQEVIVVGYGTQRKRENISSISKIAGAEVADKPTQSFDQALGGKAAGLNVIQPNGVLNNPPVLRVRGFNSISGSSYPLIVVDGMPIYAGDNSTNSAANNGLGDINPNDIESISVLKDAAATAIYGSRAANGVILITTKKGRSGKAKVQYDMWVGITKPFNLFEVLNAREYATIKNEAKVNRGQTAAYFLDTLNGQPVDTRWDDYVYRDGFQQNHNISVSGANATTHYYLSANFSDQSGMMQKNEFQRRQTRLNIDHKVTKWLTIGTNLNYSKSINEAPNTGSVPGQAFGTAGAARLSFLSSPLASPLKADGSYNIISPSSTNQLGRNKSTDQTGLYNVKMLLDLNTFSSTTDRILADVFGEIDLSGGFRFRTQYNNDYLLIEDKTFLNPFHGDGINVAADPNDDGRATNIFGRFNRWVWTNQLMFTKVFGESHNIDAVLVAEQQRSKGERWGGNRSGVSDPYYNEYQGGYRLNDNPAGNLLTENYLLSYLGRVNYGFKSKYFASFSIRRDAFSGYAPGNTADKWGTFPGGGIGWNISQENFYQESFLANTVTDLKIKASYGKVGNIAAGDFDAISTYQSGLYGIYSTLAFNNAGNPDLKWETSKKLDVGLAFALFKGRISGEFNYYKNDIDNLVLNVPTAASLGLPGNTILKNVGKMYNTGIEIELSSTNIRNKDFSWTTDLNITTLKNKVTELAPGVNEIVGITGGLETTNITRVGYSVGSIYAIRSGGVNPENGRRIYYKQDGTAVQFDLVQGWTRLDNNNAISAVATNTDAVIVGPSLPKIFGGMQNSFVYKNFDFTFDITYSFGNYLYNGTKAGLRDQRFWNNSKDVLNRWQKKDDAALIPRVVFGDNVSNGSAFAITENVEKGDFVKFKNITLGYLIKDSGLQKAGISGIRFFVQVQNAFVITDYSGSDPEISTNGNANLAPGVDRNTLAQARTIATGLTITF